MGREFENGVRECAEGAIDVFGAVGSRERSDS